MQYINFQDIADYFQNEIDKVVDILQEAGQITQNINDNGIIKKAFKFAFFVNQGDYHKAVKEPNAAKDNDWPEIPILIKNAGGVQDTNSTIDTYLQRLELELYGWCDRTDEYKNQWADIEMILSYFCSSMKGKTDEISGNTTKIDCSDYPVLNELENRHFVAFLNMNVIIMFNAHLSNMDKIKINNREIPYLTFTEAFSTELLPDNRKTDMVKFHPNVCMYQLNITGLYARDNSSVELLVNGCTTCDLYNQPFQVEIIRDGIVLASRIMYVKEFSTIRSYGSVVAYNATFYPSFVEV